MRVILLTLLLACSSTSAQVSDVEIEQGQVIKAIFEQSLIRGNGKVLPLDSLTYNAFFRRSATLDTIPVIVDSILVAGDSLKVLLNPIDLELGWYSLWLQPCDLIEHCGPFSQSENHLLITQPGPVAVKGLIIIGREAKNQYEGD